MSEVMNERNSVAREIHYSKFWSMRNYRGNFRGRINLRIYESHWHRQDIVDTSRPPAILLRERLGFQKSLFLRWYGPPGKKDASTSLRRKLYEALRVAFVLVPRLPMTSASECRFSGVSGVMREEKLPREIKWGTLSTCAIT